MENRRQQGRANLDDKVIRVEDTLVLPRAKLRSIALSYTCPVIDESFTAVQLCDIDAYFLQAKAKGSDKEPYEELGLKVRCAGCGSWHIFERVSR